MGCRQSWLVLMLMVLALSLAIRLSPPWRTRLYFAVERQWQRNWPLNRGKQACLRIRPLFQPFVPVRVEVEAGVSLLLDPEDTVSQIILRTGAYEPESWVVVQQHLPTGGVFVDVGAHIGWYSLKSARVVGPSGRVIAVEPNPAAIRQLQDNIAATGATVIKVYPFACSDTEGILEFFVPQSMNSGQASISRDNAEQWAKASTKHRVRARPLDDIVEEAGVSQVDVIKIDVEGAEFLVLKGARRTLARFSPVLIVEMIEPQLQVMKTSTAEVKEFLRSQGYTPRRELGLNVEFVKQ